jgi:hypothetical protein
VPANKFDNLADSTAFDKEEVEKVVGLAGGKTRYLANESGSSDFAPPAMISYYSSMAR